jgi:tryptophan synthase alpha chain
MSRIAQRFEVLAGKGRTALIPFVTAGDPDPAVTVPLMHTMVAAGADLIELGVPFSDPMAEGPVIQRSSERALKHHTSLRDVLDMVREFRSDDVDTPVILMGYLNPIEVMGYAELATQARNVGVDGMLVVDAPPEETRELVTELREMQLDLIYLLAPTSTEERMRKIAEVASGFVYYVSVKGVTGAGHLDTDEVADRLAPIRRIVDLPVGVGFGIKDADTAARVARVGDAVIVGSAIVGRMEVFVGSPERIPEAVAGFLADLRAAIDRADKVTSP